MSLSDIFLRTCLISFFVSVAFSESPPKELRPEGVFVSGGLKDAFFRGYKQARNVCDGSESISSGNSSSSISLAIYIGKGVDNGRTVLPESVVGKQGVLLLIRFNRHPNNGHPGLFYFDKVSNLYGAGGALPIGASYEIRQVTVPKEELDFSAELIYLKDERSRVESILSAMLGEK